MKKALIGLAIVAFVVAGAAQPAVAQQQEDIEDQEIPINETEEDDTEEVNETEEAEDIEREERSQENSAQFDARLGTAIRTVDALIEIAPNDEAEQGLQNAMDELRAVQNSTDTASPGSEERAEEAENEPEEPGRELGEELGQEGEEGSSAEPPGTRGPSENENRPGFVNQMLGGIFG